MKLNFRSYLMKDLCFHDISIHTNFHQNRSINDFARMIWHKGGLIGPWMTQKIYRRKR